MHKPLLSLFRGKLLPPVLMLVLSVVVLCSLVTGIASAEEAAAEKREASAANPASSANPAPSPAQAPAQAPAPAPAPAAATSQASASSSQDELHPSYMLYAWLGSSLLSFVVTFLLINSGKAAELKYSDSKSTSASASATTAGESGAPAAASPAFSGTKKATSKGGVNLTWRTFVLPLVWLPLPCMFLVFSLGASEPLVLKLRKHDASEVVGFSRKRNDPGWLASSNGDLKDLVPYISMYVSYATLGFISLNVCLLLLLSVQAFAGRDPDDEATAEGPAPSSSPSP